MNPVELIRLSIEIENVILPNGDLAPIPGKESALLSVCEYPGEHPSSGGPLRIESPPGRLLFFRGDIPHPVRLQIQEFSTHQLLQGAGEVQKVLDPFTACSSVFCGVGCYFSHIPSPHEYRQAVCHSGSYAVLVDGSPVSRAWTQDSSEQACELAVETLPEFRGHGYARQVCAAWAASVLRQGKIAFYSYKIENLPSQALARSLNVVQYARMTGYT